MVQCARCSQKTDLTKMSWFNQDVLCMTCASAEESHPDYPAARSAEHAAVKRGDFNFPGIGWPGPNGRVSG